MAARTVQLLPVLEFPSGVDAPGLATPESQPWWEHRDEWEAYWQAIRSEAGIIAESPVPGSGWISEWSAASIARIVACHLKDLTNGAVEADSVGALFGGFLLLIDGEPRVFPQCCSTIASLISWSAIADDDFSRGWIGEGHPSPQVSVRRNSVRFLMRDDWEEFQPPHAREIRVDRRRLLEAIATAESEVLRLAEAVDGLRSDYEIPDLARRLIWEDEHGQVHRLALRADEHRG